MLAAEHGAAGVVVSNHGGRQLDLAPATLDVLPEIVDAVGDRLEVLLDGGIRRGDDVVVALALGARAVLAGRTPLWGLAAGGEEGAREVLELLRRGARDRAAPARLRRSGRRSAASTCARRPGRVRSAARERIDDSSPRNAVDLLPDGGLDGEAEARPAAAREARHRRHRRRTSTSAARSRCSGCARSRTQGTSAS